MSIYFIRKDWLSKTKNAKWKLSETCTEVLEILNTPRQWPHIEEKKLRMTRLHKGFFWHNIAADIKEYVKSCEKCQKQGDLKSPKVEFKSIPVPSSVMKEVGVDICNLPEVEGYCHVIVLMTWTLTKDKSAPTIAQFLYEVMCRHGRFEIQINDQGREFVNEVCKQLHELTGAEQRVTSAYHPQANRLVERQN